MTAIGWLQIIVFFAAIVAVTKPLGVYMFRVFEGDRQPLPRVLGRVERLLYRLSGVDPTREQTWKQYTFALLMFSGVGLVITYGILPAMFMGAFPEIAPLNVMRLASPSSAIVSAVVFNAIVIILLIPLALRGVKYRPLGAAAILRRSLLVYGAGGVVAPFVGIKLIDLLLQALHLA